MQLLDTPKPTLKPTNDAGIASSKSDSDNSLNFFRLLLASLVIISHAPELKDGNRSGEILSQVFHTLSFGELAVDGFFLLSGYLIVQSWQRRPNLWAFLKKRILRIYPAFIVASLVCAFVVGPLGGPPERYFTSLDYGSIVKRVLLLRTLVLPPVFAGLPLPVVNGAVWTIQYEFLCYLAVALIGTLGLLRSRWIIPLLALGAALASFLKVPGHSTGLLAHYSLPSIFRFASFFFAGGTYFLFQDKISLTRKAALWCSLLVCFIMFFPALIKLALPALGGYSLLYFGLRPFSPALRRLTEKNDISYGVYLYGWPLQMLVYWYWPDLPVVVACCLVLVLAALFGLASWYFVEKPALALKNEALLARFICCPARGVSPGVRTVSEG